MDLDERLIFIRRELVHGSGVRLRLPDATPDESLFFLIAVLAGGIVGYLFANL